MIRRDYILQMIEEFIRALTQIRALRQQGRWQEARLALDAECEKLAAAGARNLACLSETELLARLAQDQPTSVVRQRLFLMIALLQEAGEIAEGQGCVQEARGSRIKALHLLLEVSADSEVGDHPAFVPGVDALVNSLAGGPWPARTQVLLMRHYESTGQLGKAEDSLYSILEATSNDPASVAFGLAFYERILRRSDLALEEGNLPRAEAEEGHHELKRLPH
jgi:tetratricopeptide (TPR) repeat protein